MPAIHLLGIELKENIYRFPLSFRSAGGAAGKWLLRSNGRDRQIHGRRVQSEKSGRKKMDSNTVSLFFAF